MTKQTIIKSVEQLKQTTKELYPKLAKFPNLDEELLRDFGWEISSLGKVPTGRDTHSDVIKVMKAFDLIREDMGVKSNNVSVLLNKYSRYSDSNSLVGLLKDSNLLLMSTNKAINV